MATKIYQNSPQLNWLVINATRQTTIYSKYCSLLPQVAKVVDIIGYNKRGITYLLYKTISYIEEYMCTYKTSTGEKQE